MFSFPDPIMSDFRFGVVNLLTGSTAFDLSMFVIESMFEKLY